MNVEDASVDWLLVEMIPASDERRDRDRPKSFISQQTENQSLSSALSCNPCKLHASNEQKQLFWEGFCRCLIDSGKSPPKNALKKSLKLLSDEGAWRN